MGYGIVVACSSCGTRESYMLGVGMAYGRLENVIEYVSQRRRDQVLDILANHRVEEVEYEHRLFVCSQCETLHYRFYYRLAYDAGKVLEPSFRCGTCRTRLVEAGKDLSIYACQRCSQKTLSVHQDMVWD